MTKDTISFRCPSITKRQLDKLKKADDDNRSQVIIRAIAAYYRQRIKNREQSSERQNV